MFEMFKKKMVIVVRSDLQMSTGKTAAQAAHVAVRAAEQASDVNKIIWKHLNKETKIVLQVKTKDDLISLIKQSKAAGIPFSAIKDAGRTEIEPNTLTAIALGPDDADKIDRLTGSLKLL